MKINKQIVVCVAGIFFFGGYSLNAQAAESSPEMIIEQKEIEGLMADKDINQISGPKQWGERNPFNTSMFQGVSLSPMAIKRKSTFVLQGIFLGSSKPSVIINETVIGVGGEIEGATVKRIDDDSVVLIDGKGKRIVLSSDQ